MVSTPLVGATSLKHLIRMQPPTTPSHHVHTWDSFHVVLVFSFFYWPDDSEQKLRCIFCNITAGAPSHSIIDVTISPPPTSVHIIDASECIISCGEEDTADAIQLGMLTWRFEMMLGHLGARVLLREDRWVKGRE